MISAGAEHFANREGLDAVVDAGAGAVRVDVVDVVRRKSGVFEGGAHTTDGAAAFRVDVGDAVGVGRRAVPDDFAVNFRAAFFGVFEFFEDEDAGAFAEDKAVASFIEGARGFFRLVVGRAESGEEVETGNAERVNHRVRAAGEHHVGFVAADKFGRFADRLGARGAGGEAVDVRAFGAEVGGQVSGGHIRLLFEFANRVEDFEPFFDEFRFVEFAVFVETGEHHRGEIVEVLRAFARAGVNAEAFRIEVGSVVAEETGVFHRLVAGADRELRMSVLQLPIVGIFADRGNIPILDFGGDLRREIRRVEQSDATDARFAVQQTAPNRFDVGAQRRNQTNTRNDNSTFSIHITETFL